jgi:uncharacterized membrane protein
MNEVDTKSAWLSKINWTQLVSVAASLLVVFGLSIPAEQQAEIVALIQAIQGLATWIMRTWFTSTITPPVAAKL